MPEETKDSLAETLATHIVTAATMLAGEIVHQALQIARAADMKSAAVKEADMKSAAEKAAMEKWRAAKTIEEKVAIVEEWGKRTDSVDGRSG
jgi:LPS O-antigen subunit length determinant protein (WzzB/FepE family)